MQTRLTEMVGCEFPIVAFSHCRDVIAAVTNAGGFGVLGASSFTPEELEIELKWIEEHTHGHPCGIDVLIPLKFETTGPDGARPDLPETHRRFVDDLMKKYDVPELPPDEARALRKASANRADLVSRASDLWALAASYNVKMFVSALGPPPPPLIAEAHAHGAVVGGLVGAVQHAERQRAAGVDFVVAQGYEAGGHVGEISTMVLVPDVVDAMDGLPVIAAGGIASGRQMAAAIALGAGGVWTGSVWLTTHEAETHPVVKEKFLKASASDTLRSRSSTGKPARQLRSAWTDEWEDAANPKPLGMPQHGMLIGEARARIARSAYTPGSGAEQLINYFVGQAVGRLNTAKPARQVVEEMINEYIDVMSRFEMVNA